MMSGMDDAIGRVLTKIRELGQEDNTIYFFIGDNGGPTQSTTSQNGGFSGFKMTTLKAARACRSSPSGKANSRPARRMTCP